MSLLHGGDGMDAVYFWSAILIVLTPVLVFGGIGIWLWRMYLGERATRKAERGTGGPA